MGNRNKDRLAKLNTAVKPGTEEGATTPHSASGVRSLLQRDTTLSKIASGSRRTVNLLMHPPERIRMWSDHNRNYELLSIQRCADLIDGFTRSGAQEFPAVVRKVADDSNIDYEIICGARRHWTAAHLGWQLLIEVRDLNDRQAFILQDLENRDREDISDYERAIDYRQALPKFFDGSRAQMAQFLEIDKANFHRLLELSELPKAVVAAYTDLRELKVHHGTAYRKLLAEPQCKRRLLDAARSIKAEQLPGAKVFSALKKAASPSSAKALVPTEKIYGNIKATRVGKEPQVQVMLSLTITDYAQLTLAMTEQLRANFELLVADLQDGSF